MFNSIDLTKLWSDQKYIFNDHIFDLFLYISDFLKFFSQTPNQTNVSQKIVNFFSLFKEAIPVFENIKKINDGFLIYIG